MSRGKHVYVRPKMGRAPAPVLTGSVQRRLDARARARHCTIPLWPDPPEKAAADLLAKLLRGWQCPERK